MKNKFSKSLPLVLAGALQVMPMLRTVLPMQTQGLAPSTWAIVLKLATGAVAIFGFHGISSASSIAISPPNATVGQSYNGTVTYSGSHAGSVSSMKLTNNCLSSSFAFVSGLNIIYSGGNKATVSGIPTTAGNFPFQLRIFSANSCGAGDNDTRSATLVVGSSGGGGIAPSFSSPPESGVAQIGSDVLLSAAAGGTPVPGYYWKQGLTPIPGATNSTLPIPNVQLTNAGLYTVFATNSAGTNSATAYLSVCLTPGSNVLAFHYTNYVTVSNALVLPSYITNAPTGSNVYKWQWQYIDITAYSTSGNNLSLAGSQVFSGHSGTYSVTFNGVVGATTVVNQQQYDSYWAFGTPPGLDNSPPNTNVVAGANVVLSTSAYVLRTPYTNQTVSFQWYRNGTNLLASETVVGGTLSYFTDPPSPLKVYTYSNAISSLTLANVATTNAGTYTVVASNFWGSVTSSPAILTVSSGGTAPGITTQPSPRSVLLGQNASFAVTATGTDPRSYQWKKDNVNLSNGGVYAGVNTNTLILTGVGTNQAGSYSVTITNVAGATNSTGALLAVVSPPNVSLSSDGGNTVQLSANTLTGLTYVVQTATNLTTPIVWSSKATNVVPPSGAVLFTNTSSMPQAYFRLSFP